MTRIAVAYLFEGAAAERLNKLRRTYDPESAATVDAHVTLAAPIEWNGTTADAADVLTELLRSEQAFELTVDGVGTFLPASPTCFAVVGPRARLTALHDLIVAHLGSKERWPFVPHATICEYLTPERTAEVVKKLQPMPLHFQCHVDSVSLLRQVKGTRWQPIHELPLGGTIRK